MTEDVETATATFVVETVEPQRNFVRLRVFKGPDNGTRICCPIEHEGQTDDVVDTIDELSVGDWVRATVSTVAPDVSWQINSIRRLDRE